MKSKKLIFVILLIFIITLILNLGVYATSVPRPSEPYTYPYWIIFESASGYLSMCESRYPIKVSLKSGKLDSFHRAGPAFFWYVDNWNIYNSIYTDNGGNDYKECNATGDTILYANHDILNYYNDTVFFSKTLPVYHKDLKEVLEENPPLTLMSPLIRGISPFLIGLLIALVAFWKAWQFLFKTLRKA